MPLPKALADLTKALRARTIFASPCECANAVPDPLAALAADAIDRLAKALEPLRTVAECWDEDGLDEDRPSWRRRWEAIHGAGSKPPEFENVELLYGRGGKRLLTLADALAARDALEADVIENTPAARGGAPEKSSHESVARLLRTLSTFIVSRDSFLDTLVGRIALPTGSIVRVDEEPAKVEPSLPMSAELFGAIWDVLNGSPSERPSASEESAFERRARTRLLDLMPGPELFPAPVDRASYDLAMRKAAKTKSPPVLAPSSVAQLDWNDAMASKGAWSPPREAPPADEAPKAPKEPKNRALTESDVLALAAALRRPRTHDDGCVPCVPLTGDALADALESMPWR